MSGTDDDRKQPRTQPAWEGGGRDGTAPEQGSNPGEGPDFGRTDRYANADEGSDYNRKEVPGGSFHPSRTPGGTGPSTRDTDHAVVDDANESLIGRARIAGDLQVKPKRPENDPDR